VVIARESGAATVKEQVEAQRAELLRGVRADPLVQAVLAKFPGAEIVDVRGPQGAPPSAAEHLDGVAEPPEDDDV
jgi:DNA polymerase-3 subunit gamma/tau